MRNVKKKIPEFKNEDDERRFWATADSTEYVDWPAGKRRKLAALKPSLRTISLRLPVSMIEDLRYGESPRRAVSVAAQSVPCGAAGTGAPVTITRLDGDRTA